jgi:hypothetical protein
VSVSGVALWLHVVTYKKWMGFNRMLAPAMQCPHQRAKVDPGLRDGFLSPGVMA